MAHSAPPGSEEARPRPAGAGRGPQPVERKRVARRSRAGPRAGQSAQLDATFTALADPTRRAILARLARGEAGVTELQKPFAMSLPAISKHLKVLERARLISRGRDAQWRPCRLKAKPLAAAAGWIAGYKRFWEESFERLDEYLLTITQETKR